MAIPIATSDDGRIVAASGRTCGTIVTTTNHVITEAEMYAAGGHVHVLAGGTNPLVCWLPPAKQAKGMKVTMLKPALAVAFSFAAVQGAKIEDSAPDKRYENVTAELAACTLLCDGVNWRVVSSKGTWVKNDT